MRNFNILITKEFHLINKILLVLQIFPWLRLMDRVARGVSTTADEKVLTIAFQQWWFYGKEHGDDNRTKYDWLMILAHKCYGHTWIGYGAIYNFSIVYRIYDKYSDYEYWIYNGGWQTCTRILGITANYEEFMALGLIPFDPIQFSCRRLYHSIAGYV